MMKSRDIIFMSQNQKSSDKMDEIVAVIKIGEV